MASLETIRGRQVPAWQQANRYYQQPTDYIAEMQSRSQSATAPATRKRRNTNGGYTIQKGDTLSAIARRYGTTVQAIAEANGIQDVNKIYVGDNLTIPGTTTAKAQPKASTKSVKQNNTTTTNNASNTSSANTVTNTGFTEQQMADINRYASTLNQNRSTTNNQQNTSTRVLRQSRVPEQNYGGTLQNIRRNGLTERAGSYVDESLYRGVRSRRYTIAKAKPKSKKKNTSYVRENLQKVFDHEVIKRMKPDRPYYPNMRMQNIF